MESATRGLPPHHREEGASQQVAERARTLTMLVDEIFRLNAAFLAEGDLLAAQVGLTAARWRVLGMLANESASVAEIARRRGLKRQSVQESVERLERDGMVVRLPNEADRRAPLVVLTERGRTAIRDIEPIRAEWAQKRADGINIAHLQTTLASLQKLRSTPPEWPAAGTSSLTTEK